MACCNLPAENNVASLLRCSYSLQTVMPSLFTMFICLELSIAHVCFVLCNRFTYYRTKTNTGMHSKTTCHRTERVKLYIPVRGFETLRTRSITDGPIDIPRNCVFESLCRTILRYMGRYQVCSILQTEFTRFHPSRRLLGMYMLQNCCF